MTMVLFLSESTRAPEYKTNYFIFLFSIITLIFYLIFLTALIRLTTYLPTKQSKIQIKNSFQSSLAFIFTIFTLLPTEALKGEIIYASW